MTRTDAGMSMNAAELAALISAVFWARRSGRRVRADPAGGCCPRAASWSLEVRDRGEVLLLTRAQAAVGTGAQQAVDRAGHQARPGPGKKSVTASNGQNSAPEGANSPARSRRWPGSPRRGHRGRPGRPRVRSPTGAACRGACAGIAYPPGQVMETRRAARREAQNDDQPGLMALRRGGERHWGYRVSPDRRAARV